LHVRLSAGYGPTRVLDGLELDLSPGDCLGVVGTSGAGKSTLVLALLGLLPWRGGWAKGEIQLRGQNLLELKERQMRRLRGREIALVPQSPMSALNPSLSLGDHFREAWRAHQQESSGFRERLHELLLQVQLPTGEAFLKRRPNEVSVGQAQRAVLAMALLHRPALLVADEPTSALDAVTQREVLDLFRHVVSESGTTLVLISHDLVSVLQVCREIAVLTEGRLAARRYVCNLTRREDHPALRSLLQTLPVPVELMLEHLRDRTAEGTTLDNELQPSL